MTKTSHDKPLTINKALTYGWETFLAHWKPLTLLSVISLVLSFAPSLIVNEFNQNQQYLVAIGVNLLSTVLSIFFFIGVTQVTLKIYDKEKTGYDDLFTHIPTFFNYLAVSLFVGIATLVGFILLIIPGIIWATRFQLAPYLVIDKGMGPFEAMRESWRITKGQTLNLIGYGFVLGVIGILGLLAAGIGIIVAQPVLWLAIVFIYRKLATVD